MLFGERLRRALLLGTAPGPFAPDQRDRAPEAGHVGQAHLAAAVAVGDHPRTRGSRSAGRGSRLRRGQSRRLG